MDIKPIKLSPKRGGHGKVTSFSVNIGSAEARNCGWLNEDDSVKELEKIIDTEAGTITFRLKKSE